MYLGKEEPLPVENPCALCEGYRKRIAELEDDATAMRCLRADIRKTWHSFDDSREPFAHAVHRYVGALRHRVEKAEARVQWLTMATTAEPTDADEDDLVDWLRAQRTLYEEKMREAEAERDSLKARYASLAASWDMLEAERDQVLEKMTSRAAECAGLRAENKRLREACDAFENNSAEAAEVYEVLYAANLVPSGKPGPSLADMVRKLLPKASDNRPGYRMVLCRHKTTGERSYHRISKGEGPPDGWEVKTESKWARDWCHQGIHKEAECHSTRTKEGD